MLTLILTIAIIGLLVYLIETYIPMSPPIATLLRVVVVVCVVVYLLRFLGVDVALPKL